MIQFIYITSPAGENKIKNMSFSYFYDEKNFRLDRSTINTLFLTFILLMKIYSQ